MRPFIINPLMTLRFFIVLFLNVLLGFSQPHEAISLNKLNENNILLERNKSHNKMDNDSIKMRSLKDHKVAAKFDEKWFELLYDNTLYDTVYKSITELQFEDIDYPELPTDTLIKRLNELDAKTPFNIAYNPSLESVIKSYLKNRRNTIQKLITLSSFYFPLFEQELDNENIPLEIKYLAVVESALNPKAKSRVGATGLWQFMFATGKMYGLDVSSYVDERSDPIKSTKAAAKYLARLYNIFDDWDLALAAYNSGPGNVTKAIRRSGGNKNYWNIRHNLPRETAGYLPTFLAYMYIFEYSKEHGFKKYKNETAYFETDTIRVKNMITLNHVSELTGTPIEKLQFLNPSYKLDIIPFIKEENYAIRLPNDVVGLFVNNEDSIYAFAKSEFDKREKPLVQLIESEDKVRYTVKSGDNLGAIGKRYGVNISDIKRWNGLQSNIINIGQKLTIYRKNPVLSVPVKTESSEVVKSESNTITTNNIKTYVVKSGDTLWGISKKFPGITVQNIIDWNNIDGNNISTGMALKIAGQ